MLQQTDFFLFYVKMNRHKKASNGGGGGWIWSPERAQAREAAIRRVVAEGNQAQPSQERIDDYLFACSQVHARAQHAAQDPATPVLQQPMSFHIKKKLN